MPRAFVVRAKIPQAQELTAEEVYNFSRSRLASYKALDGGVIFVEEIPRTASGKIQRFKLSQMNSYREIMASLLNRFEGANSSITATSAASDQNVNHNNGGTSDDHEHTARHRPRPVQIWV